MLPLEIHDPDPEFRALIRTFLEESLPQEIAHRPAVIEPLDLAIQERWHRILAEKGWAMPYWPVEYGGTGWTQEQLSIFYDELGAAGAPSLHTFTVLIAPVLYTFGSQAQKDRHLPGLYNGTVRWCQGFSEPNSGSDLATLTSRAIRNGDHFVVNGSKIWTTFAHRADWMFCLVRTSDDGKPQAGISFLLIDMKSPGITIRPITTIDRLHHLNQVFFEDVRVPLENLIGEENRGWHYAKFLLEVERFNAAPLGQLKSKLLQLRRLAEASPRAIEDDQFRRKLAQLEINFLALEALSLRQASRSGTLPAGAGAPVLKLLGAQLLQRTSELAVEATGPYALVDQVHALVPGANMEIVGPEEGPAATLSYFFGRAATIYGGATEVQKNIIYRQLAR